MRYCPDCGNPHECTAETERGPNPEVEIARINADRDKYVARVTARMQRDELDTAEDIAETQAEASIVGDIAAAEIIAAEDPAEAAPETGEPIVVDVPDAPAPEEPAAEEPPVVETRAPRESGKGGYWGMYR